MFIYIYLFLYIYIYVYNAWQASVLYTCSHRATCVQHMLRFYCLCCLLLKGTQFQFSLQVACGCTRAVSMQPVCKMLKFHCFSCLHWKNTQLKFNLQVACVFTRAVRCNQNIKFHLNTTSKLCVFSHVRSACNLCATYAQVSWFLLLALGKRAV